MFTCWTCSRKLKTEQKTGGHMSGEHPGDRTLREQDAGKEVKLKK